MSVPSDTPDEDAAPDNSDREADVADQPIETPDYPANGQVMEVAIPVSELEVVEDVELSASTATAAALISAEIPLGDDDQELYIKYVTRSDVDVPEGMNVGYERVTGNDQEDYGQRYVAPDEKTARGLLLQLFERFGFREQQVRSELGRSGGFDLASHDEWQAHLSERDRKLRLLDIAEARSTNAETTDLNGELVQRYLDEGTWRETGLTDDQQALAERIRESIDPVPLFCYRNAAKTLKLAFSEGAREAGVTNDVTLPVDASGTFQTDAVADGFDRLPFVEDAQGLLMDGHRIEYVEGLYLPGPAGRAVQHAWVEIDGRVTELTHPWHAPDPADRKAVYLGSPAPWGEVIAAASRRDSHGPVRLDDATVMSGDGFTKAAGEPTGERR